MKKNKRILLVALMLLCFSVALLVLVPSSRYLQKQATYKELYATAFSDKDYHNNFSEREIAVVSNWVKIPLHDSTIRKAWAIEKFLLDTIARHSGNVDFNAEGSSALAYMANCFAKKTIADCGAYTRMLSLLYTAYHIPYRVVDVHGIPDTSIGAHTFCEVYLIEKKQWAYTDLTTNIFALQDSSGRYLNALDVQYCIAANNFSAALFFCQSDSIISAAWSNKQGAELRCFVPSVQYLFFTDNELDIREKAKYVFLPKVWYKSFSQKIKNSNLLYWIRLLCGWLGVLGMVIVWIAKRCASSRKQY